MTPRKPPPKEDLSSPILKWALGIASTGFIGLFVFLWNLNQQLAIMQSNDRFREERVKDIDKNVSTLINEMRSMKDNDVQDIKDRLKTLEVQNDKKK
jgi:hypothetical protein